MLTKHDSSPRSGWKFALLLPVLALVLCFCRATDDLSDPDTLASFPGGTEMMLKYLGNNIKYPESSKQANSQGKVYIKFFIEKDGSISDPTCVNTDKISDQALIDESIRLVNSMPKWEPGIKNGKPVKTQFVLPIGFKLSDN